jgi:DNA-binding FrmR family transcriptional regulator
MINSDVEKRAITRLRKIEGQIKGIQRMIVDRRYCIDVITQLSAAESALRTVAEIILKNHLETCVHQAFVSPDTREREAKISELMKVYKNLQTH